MGWRERGESQTRWDEARDALAEIADIAVQYDKDGIDIFFLNNKAKGEGLKVSLAIVGFPPSLSLRCIHRPNIKLSVFSTASVLKGSHLPGRNLTTY